VTLQVNIYGVYDMTTFWIVVKIDEYGDSGWTRNFDGLEVFANEDDAKKYASEYEEDGYACSTEIIKKEI
jgi:hypothetical protein